MKRKSGVITSADLFLGMDEAGPAARLMGHLGHPIADLHFAVRSRQKPAEAASFFKRLFQRRYPFTPAAKGVLEGADRIARKWGHDAIGEEHILGAFLEDWEGYSPRERPREGAREAFQLEPEVFSVLGEFGLTAERFRSALG